MLSGLVKMYAGAHRFASVVLEAKWAERGSKTKV